MVRLWTGTGAVLVQNGVQNSLSTSKDDDDCDKLIETQEEHHLGY